MALNKNATDGVINGWKNSNKLGQTAWRGTGKGRGMNYGQVLRSGAKPSDQPDDGPPMPNNPNADAWMDVYEAPNGFGWAATFVATEPGPVLCQRTVSCHEDGPLVEPAWALVPPPVAP